MNMNTVLIVLLSSQSLVENDVEQNKKVTFPELISDIPVDVSMFCLHCSLFVFLFLHFHFLFHFITTTSDIHIFSKSPANC
jgi:hypothetical protein